MEPFKVAKYPLSTEKGIRLMESENKLVFLVDRSASKQEIKEAIEKMFKVKVDRVSTMIGASGRKRAYVRLAAGSPAIEVATQLGLM
ncbi:50S ribosomal protein L23 [Candidatus Woesearchaeota archaeon]|nr:50S ribosomal protein L23 [Candidatus Woesearchaeota archaeon]